MPRGRRGVGPRDGTRTHSFHCPAGEPPHCDPTHQGQLREPDVASSTGYSHLARGLLRPDPILSQGAFVIDSTVGSPGKKRPFSSPPCQGPTKPHQTHA